MSHHPHPSPHHHQQQQQQQHGLIRNGAAAGQNGTPRQNESPLQSVLRSGTCILSGGRDRQGGAILTFPRNSPALEKVRLDDLGILLDHLTSIPSEEVRRHGFTIIIDMRDHGSRWNNVKDILRGLQERFTQSIRTILIVKPDSFTHKPNLSKYGSEILLISVDQLTKYLNVSELTTDLGGTLHYDHREWLSLRSKVQEFTTFTADVLKKMDQHKQAMLHHGELANDLPAVEALIVRHHVLREELDMYPVEKLSERGKQILAAVDPRSAGDMRLGPSTAARPNIGIANNPDLQAALSRLRLQVERLDGIRGLLHKAWQIRLDNLEQCKHLRSFEQQAEQMLGWINFNRKKFLATYTDIGISSASVKTLEQLHKPFHLECSETFHVIERVIDLGNKMKANHHYASPAIGSITTKLRDERDAFRVGLEDRGKILDLSAVFHRKVEEFKAKSPGWAAACEATWSPLDSGSLEAVQRNHEEMTKSMAQLYSEICFDGSSLLKTMHGSGEVISGDSETARAEFTRAGHYIRDLVTAVQKEHAYLITLCKKTKGALEDQWALRLYQEELRQVIRWIQKDADPFLASNREIGQNLADANKHRAVHAAFEKNAKNTYSNADQLLEASHVLMEKQGFNVEDVQISAEQLHRCVTEFRGKVQARHKMLDTACSFFEQVAVLTPLLERANNPPPIEPRVLESLELIIEEVQRLKHEKQAVVETRADAKQVGCKLLQQLVDSSMADSADYQHVYATLGTILQHREQVDETFEQRRRQLEIFQRFRMFERSVMEISEKVAVWSESVQQHSMSGGGERLSADQAAQEYGRVKSRLAELQTLSDQAGNRGQELLELLEGFDPVSTTVDGEPMSCRVNVCLQELADHLGNFAEDAETYRLYLRNILQLHKCNSHGQQILDSMRHLQGVLRNLSLRLVSLEDSRRVLEVYARHQANVEKLHGIVRTFETSAHDIAANDVDAADVAERLRDVISKQWDSLYKLSEDLGRGITTGVKFYHTAEKVCAFLQGLQKEYQYDEDWCSKLRDKAEAMEQMVRKHIKTKDDFMTFCSNLRKTSETFLKFVSRSYTTFTDNKESLHGVDTQINGLLGHIKRLEDDVLALWGHRKKQFDFCLQFISVETSAQKVIKWIEGTGEDYLSTRTSVGNTQAATEALLAEHNDFIRNSKENTEKIGMVMMLAEGLVKNGQNPHAAGIKSCVQAVGEHQRNFLSRMDAYRLQLEIKLGRVSNKVPPPPPEPLTDRNSDGSLDSKLHAMSGSHVSVEEAKKAKQRDGVMSELLSSERSYVKSLSDLIQCFVHEAKTCASGIRPPPGLSAKLPRIFGNIEDIYDFHNEVFLKELEKYEMMPEDCAHCFMTWSPKFDMYVEFCKDQGATAAAVQEPTVVEYFSKVQSFYNLPSTHTIGFYLIMPVQRITRYKELLEKLLKNCVDERGEIREALDLMRNQPKKTNFAMNLDLLDNYDEPLEQLGELILIDAFQVSEPKQRIPKTHQRQVFLFELAILFTKKTDVPGSKDPKFVYKNKLMTAGLGITEDDKESPSFVIWMGRTGTPTSQHSSSGDTKFVLRAPSLDVKQAWIQKLRQVVLDNCVNRSLSVALDIAASRAVGTTAAAAAAVSGSGVTPRNNCHRNRGSRDSKDYEDSLSLEEASGSTERYSIVSDHSSSTTTDSDKGLYEHGIPAERLSGLPFRERLENAANSTLPLRVAQCRAATLLLNISIDARETQHGSVVEN
ncbi:Triple functional domain protein [Hypsibius exemplaris]|uniref:Triple functional domain protein n=1 Tax=Hypsibius exemplaris TaxID=2072580 RepID=A0A9X6RKS4_HYPEX|nr:Triple functional domain protein [Hypsibius exemplaris]